MVTQETRTERWRALLVVLPLVMVLAGGCAHTSPVCLPAWESFEFSGCKDDPLGWDASGRRSSEECIRYDYDGVGTLRLTHIDTSCNCGAMAAGGDAEFLPGREIHIEMWEEVPIPAMCLCLFDVGYAVTSLRPGTYRLTVYERRVDQLGDEQFDVSLDLHGACSGEVCLPRSGYPWEPEAVDR